MNIRPFDYSDADYELYVRLSNAVYPDQPRTLEALRHFDATKGPGEIAQTFFIEQAGQAVGWFAFMTPRFNPLSGQLEVEWGLLPGHEPLSEALWGALERELARHRPGALVTRVREDWPQAAFYMARGFEVYDRMWPSTLDLGRFDPAPFQRPLPESIRIGTLADLDYHSEAVQRRYYALVTALLRDVPSAQPVELWPFELWQERSMKDKNLIPEANFIAFEGEAMVGVSQLWRSPRPQTLQTGLTGVLPSHRRRGIALALKLRALEYARQQGYRYVRTNNHQVNRPMLALNEALGFEKGPAQLHLKKSLFVKEEL
ncbi:GNAT family N-acetyltransferase [Calidithermus timidus]|uniref:GNAT family N-acetyltransferase n=1 Tax=Calidithermus timidus TaxID=307124 RepID=UPI00035FF0F7|nr:GNAT family N-acetyltransferase [Calidithermus timidus]